VPPRLTEKDIDGLIKSAAPGLSILELSLVVCFNSFQQWVGRCGAAAGAKGFSPFELLVLHMIAYGEGTKRIADVSFALKVEDSHLVSYAIKKLSKLGLVESTKSGKDTFFGCTKTGRDLIGQYGEVRNICLVRTLSRLTGPDVDLDATVDTLRLLAGLYEQAARQAETALSFNRSKSID
jgi:predicted MarR family transcription regulator